MTRYLQGVTILVAFFLFNCPCGQPQSCMPPPSGMVGWWPGDGNANDIIGGNNGTLGAGVSFVPGEVGQAFSFDGSGYLQIQSSSAVQPPSAISIAAWVYPTSFSDPTGFNTIVSKYSHAGGESWFLGAFSSTGQIEWEVDGGADGGEPYNTVVTGTNLSLGLWQHVAATFDTSTQEISLYINGVQVPTTCRPGYPCEAVTSIYQSSSPVQIGAATGDSVQSFWSGLIDEVQIFNRALSASEIQAIYNAGSAGQCKSLPTLSVSAKMDIYVAGGYNDQSAGVAPAVYTIQAGTVPSVVFSGITGAWACGAVSTYGPDGTTAPGHCNIAAGRHINNPIGPLSGYDTTDFAGGLVGVFLGDNLPTSPPPPLRFYVTDGSKGGIQTNFASLSPQIGQVFFIGDGLTGAGTGSPQVFNVPSSATRLYLGYVDSCNATVPSCYGDNIGSVVPAFATSCGFSISPTSQTFGASGGSGQTVVSTLLPPQSCPFSVAESASWIHPQGKLCPAGSGLFPCARFSPPLVSYLVDRNTTASQRTGTLTVAGQPVAITQSGTATCTYSINPSGQTFGENGGKGSVTVTTLTGCSWSAVSNVGWATISSGSSGSGNGTVTFTVAANPGTPRDGTLTIAGQTYSVTQSASGCGATDVSNKVNVTRGPFLSDPLGDVWIQTVSLYNKSSQTLPGPIYLVMDGLPRTGYPCTEIGATNPTCNLSTAPPVTFCGSPAGSDLVLFSSGSMAPTLGVSGQLTFLPPPAGINGVGSSGASGSFEYTTRVFSGTPTDISRQPTGVLGNSPAPAQLTPAASAAGSPPTVTYWVSLDTAPLIGHPAGPFAVAFQLADGSGTGDGNNAAVVGGFQFGAGGAPSQPPVVTGSAFGDLSSAVSLTDSGPVNFFYQTFTPGTTLAFEITITTNTDADDILDEFAFYILDNTLTAIPTMAGAPLDIFSSINLTTKPVLQVYASDPSRSPAGGGGPINILVPLTVGLSPGTLDFGAQGMGTTSKAQSVKLANASSGALTISSITITGTNPGDFAQTNACPSTLAAGSSCTITITFTPSATGIRQGTLSIIDDEAAPQTVVLSGKGT